MRKSYTLVRGRWTSLLSFRTLHGIKFVKFELYSSLLVDVKKVNSMPPATNSNYHYRPAPPKLIPPIGENHLLHLYHHPDHAEQSHICLTRLPKKLHEKLTCIEGINEEWGLQFIEDWNKKKISLLVVLLLVVASSGIGVLWSVYKHSISDAFAMASYVVAVVAAGVAALQFSLYDN
jgi:hypothetical protein